jgi:threonyl-tRNA synthetase
VVDGIAHQTTPLDVANGISKGLAARMVISLVDGQTWDLMRPLEQSCNLVLCDFNTPEGKHTFWHSSAHILGEAIETQFGAHLCIGPPTEDGGFYYDCFTEGRYAITSHHATLA